jgi:hypothetical protein
MIRTKGFFSSWFPVPALRTEELLSALLVFNLVIAGPQSVRKRPTGGATR